MIKAIECISDEKTVNKVSKSIISYLNSDNTYIASLNSSLSDVRKKIANIAKALEEGIITKTTKSRLLELEEQESNILEEIKEQEAFTPTLSENEIKFLFHSFAALNLKEEKNKARILDSLIESVIIWRDGTIIVTIKYSDEPLKSNINDILGKGFLISSDNKLFGSPEKTTA